MEIALMLLYEPNYYKSILRTYAVNRALVFEV